MSSSEEQFLWKIIISIDKNRYKYVIERNDLKLGCQLIGKNKEKSGKKFLQNIKLLIKSYYYFFIKKYNFLFRLMMQKSPWQLFSGYYEVFTWIFLVFTNYVVRSINYDEVQFPFNKYFVTKCSMRLVMQDCFFSNRDLRPIL